MACRSPAPAPPPPTRIDPPNACLPKRSELNQPSAWASVGRDPGGQRRSEAHGLERPGLRWVHQVKYARLYGIAVGGDGTVYASATNGIYAIDESGQRVWSQRAGPPARATPAVAAGGRAYIQFFSSKPRPFGHADLNSGSLVAFDRCGELRWKFPAPPRNIHSPVLGPDGTVYITGHYPNRSAPEALFALRPDGTRKWSKPAPVDDTFVTPPVLDGRGNLYLATLEGRLISLSPSGHSRWARVTKTRYVQLAVSDAGTLYAVATRAVEAFRLDGSSRFKTEILGYSIPSIAVADDDRIYVARGGGLHALASSGTVEWVFRQPGAALPPVVDATGTVYVVFNERGVGRLYAVDRTGQQKWLFYTEQANALAMAADGTLYIAANDRLYALSECPDASCPDDGTAVAATNLPPPPPKKSRRPRPKPASRPPPPRRERHDGYDVYPGCRPATTAIVRKEGNDFSWYTENPEDGPAKRQDGRTRFRNRALAAVPLSSHASGFGVSCVEPRGAFAVFVHPGQDVAAAARAAGEWLKQENLRGEIDIVVSKIPTLQ